MLRVARAALQIVRSAGFVHSYVTGVDAGRRAVAVVSRTLGRIMYAYSLAQVGTVLASMLADVHAIDLQREADTGR
jgi:hypothetical protein